MDRVSLMWTMCMITAVTAQQALRERIVIDIFVVNQRIVMVESAYLKIPILWTLFVFVLLEEWEYNVKQVSTIKYNCYYMLKKQKQMKCNCIICTQI